MTSLSQKFFLARRRVILPISRPRLVRIPNGTGNPKTQAPKPSLGHPPCVFVSRKYGLTAPFHPPARPKQVEDLRADHGERREVPPLRNPTISQEVRWEE